MTTHADFLKHRRSTKLAHMTSPAPAGDELQSILQTAARVPDHGKLNPWYFIVFEGENRTAFGKHLRAIYARNNPDATPEMLDHEENRLMRAPLVVAVISRVREAIIPAWEQILSAGACCYNLCLACNAHGYGANWLTEWYSFDADVHALLNLEHGRDNITGFIYIGTETDKQDDRSRPDLDLLTNYWTENSVMNNKGESYNKDGLGLPKQGFTINADTDQPKNG